MGPGPPVSASQTELIGRLDAEWRVLAGSRHLRDRLQSWAADDERLAFDDGDQLLVAAQRRDAASRAERDQVLAALLERTADDALARRVALQVVLPGVKSLINGIRGWDVEERAARVVATALDVISWCASEPAGTPPSLRIYTNTRHRVLRSAVRARSQPVVFVDNYSHLEAGEDPVDSTPEAQQIDELVEWVRQRARVRDDAARLVVMTRVAGVSVDELAAAQDVDPQTLRQRRLRTERRVRQSLVPSRRHLTRPENASRSSPPVAPYIRDRSTRPAKRRERAMQAHWPQQPEDQLRDRNVQVMTEDELDREMRRGMDDWCDLLDDLLNTGGMLPSRDLASRVVGFFEDEYWRAEDARIQGRSPFLVAAGVAIVLLSPGCRRGVRNGAPVTQTRPTRGNPVGAVIGPASTGHRSRADG